MRTVRLHVGKQETIGTQKYRSQLMFTLSPALTSVWNKWFPTAGIFRLATQHTCRDFQDTGPGAARCGRRDNPRRSGWLLGGPTSTILISSATAQTQSCLSRNGRMGTTRVVIVVADAGRVTGEPYVAGRILRRLGQWFASACLGWGWFCFFGRGSDSRG